MASTIPKQVKVELTDRFLPAVETTWKVALYGINFVYDPATHIHYADINAAWELPNGSGYATGGATLANRTSTQVGVTAVLDADDRSWTAASFTVYWAVVYDTTSGHIRGVYDLSGPITVTAGTFTIIWDVANGLIKIS
jgi:hypothetical protein